MITSIKEGNGKVALLFPEGRTVYGDPKNKEMSDRWATKAGLPIYNEVLHPRTLGFKTYLETFGSALDYVYDYTIAYESQNFDSAAHGPKQMPRETDILPRAVHLHVRRMTPAEFMKECNNDPEQYVKESFKRKEEVLTKFYASPAPRCLPGPKQNLGGSKADPNQMCRVIFLYVAS